LVDRTTDGSTRFIGSCFALRRRDHLLTAAHCARDVRGTLEVCYRTADGISTSSVASVIVHPRADVAALKLAGGSEFDDMFAGDTSLFTWGMPVSAFGYPDDVGRSVAPPTPRYFRGSIQRLFSHSSHLGYSYDAAELSFSSPGGLSGGPVTPDADYSMAMGVVVENLNVSRALYSISETTTETAQDNVITRVILTERAYAVIDYAVVVLLDPLTAWLDEHIPYPGAGV
jgi:hypothetical protein